MHHHVIDGIQIELDDDVDPSEIGAEALAANDAEPIDVDALIARELDDPSGEDDTAAPVEDDERGDQ